MVYNSCDSGGGGGGGAPFDKRGMFLTPGGSYAAELLITPCKC